jgi:hypothetical protein
MSDLAIYARTHTHYDLFFPPDSEVDRSKNLRLPEAIASSY